MSVLIDQFTDLPLFDEEMAAALLDRVRHTWLSKGEELLRIGDVSKNIYFLELGAMTAEWTKGTKKVISRLVAPGELCSPVSSFFNQTPSSEILLAKSDCLVSFLSHEDFALLEETFPVFNKLLMGLLIKQCIFLHEAIDIMRLRKKEERYAWLKHNRSDLFKLFPDKLLCSYLGMSSVSYSHILKFKKTNT